MKTIIASILILVPVAYPGILFFDDFEDGDDDGWTHYGGAGFEVSSGVYYVRPAGRTHLEVEVLYRPGSGNC